jgi:AraC-like DNA-binding protein
MQNKEWHSQETKVIVEQEKYIKLDYGCSGKGELTIYHVFPGVYLYFMDMDTSDVLPTQVFPKKMISISHCKKGRYECQFPNRTLDCLSEGQFSINGTEYLPVCFSFPLKKYEGLSVVLDMQAIPQQVRQLMQVFGVEFGRLSGLMKGEKYWYISLPTKELADIFEAVYQGKREESTDYFRIKVMEMLYHIEKMRIEKRLGGRYFNKEQAQITKDIKEYLISHIDENISVEKLVTASGINLNVFYQIFMEMYGETPYAYLKRYRMNVAAVQLLTGDRRIVDIAMDLGYSNASKFAKAFYSIYGELPREYRKKRK